MHTFPSDKTLNVQFPLKKPATKITVKEYKINDDQVNSVKEIN